MADPMQDPSMAQEGDESAEGGGFSVTVTDNGDGTYSIEASDADAQQEGEQSGPQTANSLEEACQMMEQMFQDESGEDASQPEDGEDPNAPLPADKAASVWNQMASKKSKGPM